MHACVCMCVRMDEGHILFVYMNALKLRHVKGKDGFEHSKRVRLCVKECVSTRVCLTARERGNSVCLCAFV